jgi:hypothetical protein
MNPLYQRIGGQEGISNLLYHFYADVRQDPLIGPIFSARIKDWKEHLKIIASFWDTLIGGPRIYAPPNADETRTTSFARGAPRTVAFSLTDKLSTSTADRCRSRNDRPGPTISPTSWPDSRDLR